MPKRAPTLAFTLPDWFQQLQAATPTEQSGILWRTEAASTTPKGIKKQVAEYKDNLNEEQLDQAAAFLQHATQVGVGVPGGPFSVQPRAGLAVSFAPQFWIDHDAPDQLLCALNKACPPLLWFPVGQTLAAIRSTLAVYFPGRPPDPAVPSLAQMVRLRQEYPRPEWPTEWVTVRLLFGLVEDMANVENSFVFLSEFCRDFNAQATAETMTHKPVAITAFNTVNSYAEIILEQHQWLTYSLDDEESEGHPVVAQITYPPAGQAAVVTAFNGDADTDFPADVPVDVLGALLRFPIKDLARLRLSLDEAEDPVDITYVMGLLVAVDNDNDTLIPALRPYMTHASPQVRAKVARYAHVRAHDDLVREMLAVEQDPEAQTTMHALLGTNGHKP